MKYNSRIFRRAFHILSGFDQKEAPLLVAQLLDILWPDQRALYNARIKIGVGSVRVMVMYQPFSGRVVFVDLQ